MTSSRRTWATRALAAVLAIATTTAMAACSSTDSSSGSGDGTAKEVRLGYFPNLTHAPAIVGDKQGLFSAELGNTTLTVSIFPTGNAAMEALKSGAIDATFTGPGPATTTFLNSRGKAVKVVAGATSGGAALVVDPAISSVQDLRGKKIATPQLGNTQDISVRTWLKSNGLNTDLQGGGDVSITPVENAQVVDAFTQKSISGAWVPEPYATRLVKAGGKVLVDERTLWPNGQFPTTILAVNPSFLEKNKSTVAALIRGESKAIDRITADPAAAKKNVNDVISAASGKPMSADILDSAWNNLSFTLDPLSEAISKDAQDARDVGILTSDPDLKDFIDVSVLNDELTTAGKPKVSS